MYLLQFLTVKTAANSVYMWYLDQRKYLSILGRRWLSVVYLFKFVAFDYNLNILIFTGDNHKSNVMFAISCSATRLHLNWIMSICFHCPNCGTAHFFPSIYLNCFNLTFNDKVFRWLKLFRLIIQCSCK